MSRVKTSASKHKCRHFSRAADELLGEDDGGAECPLCAENSALISASSSIAKTHEHRA